MKVIPVSSKEREQILGGNSDSVLFVAEDGSYMAYTILLGQFYVHDTKCFGGSAFAALIQRLREEAKRLGYTEAIFQVEPPNANMERFVETLVASGRGKVKGILASMRL